MSDLYLVLRNRLDAVPEWVYIDTATLRGAREGKGLSYETTARELHVSAKTYERYEKAGRVPRPLLPALADLFDLEIEEPARRRVAVSPPEEGEGRSGLESRLDAIEQLLEGIDRKWDQADIAGRLVAIEREVAAIRNLAVRP
jgi:transcriptional regulator with XRE-family HTH domain